MIILIGHRKQVGKNTFGGYLRTALMGEKTEKNWKLLSNVNLCSFAYELKHQCHLMFGHLGLHDTAYYEKNPQAKDQPLACGKTPRDIWIEYGQSCKKIDPSIWARQAIAKCQGISIFTDFRFVEEMPTDRKFATILVMRPGIPDTHDKADDALEGFQRWDFFVTNEENQQQKLYESARVIARRLLDALP